MSVVGNGETKHPRNGNATLTTSRLDGSTVRTPLWINSFSTDLNLQIDSGQLRTKLVHRPIRLSERFLIFTTIWNVLDRPKYEALLRKIKEHWAHNLNEDQPTSMKLRYYGADKNWRGFIEGADIGYAVTDVILSYTFTMRIIPDVADKVARVIGWDAPYVPTSQDVKDYGNMWYDQGQFTEDEANRLRGQNNGAQVGNNPDNNPTRAGEGKKR